MWCAVAFQERGFWGGQDTTQARYKQDPGCNLNGTVCFKSLSGGMEQKSKIFFDKILERSRGTELI